MIDTLFSYALIPKIRNQKCLYLFGITDDARKYVGKLIPLGSYYIFYY